MKKLPDNDSFWAAHDEAQDSIPEEITIDLSEDRLLSFGFTSKEIQAYHLDFEYLILDCEDLAGWEIPDFIGGRLTDLLEYCKQLRVKTNKDHADRHKRYKDAGRACRLLPSPKYKFYGSSAVNIL